MLEFRFVNPLALLLFIPAVFLLFRWIRGQWNSIPAVMRYSDVRLMQGLPPGVRVRLRRVPDILRLFAWSFLVIALARPQWGSAQEIIETEGIDIVMAIDISRSMSIPDFNPLNRLDAAKVVIQEFIDGREFDRIGVVVFATNAFQQAPPTLDYDVLSRLLDDVQLATDLGLPGDQTAIGEGIASAANMLRSNDAAGRVIVLLTDGENNAGLIDPLTAAEAAQALGIRVYTIGMGAPGTVAVNNITGETQIRDGELDETMLSGIARIANGKYYNALNLFDLQEIYAEIDQLERVRMERQITVRWQDRAWGWLIASFVLLLLERLLRYTVFQTIP